MVSSTSALRRLSPLEHRAAGGAALARPRHLEVDSAHRRDEPPQVGAVAAVDPLGLALPLLRADQGPDLLLQDDLQGDPDRALAEGPEVGAEVLLRRQFKLGNLVHWKLLGLAGKRDRWCWLPRSFHFLFSLRELPIHTILGTQPRSCQRRNRGVHDSSRASNS